MRKMTQSTESSQGGLLAVAVLSITGNALCLAKLYRARHLNSPTKLFCFVLFLFLFLGVFFNR